MKAHIAVAALLAGAMLFFASPSRAMTIKQFDELEDRYAAAHYVADLVEAAENSLKDAGRADDASKVSKLFTTNTPDSKQSISLQQFYYTLALVRVDDAEHAEHSDIADVLSLDLQNNDRIKLPDHFFKLADILDKKYAQPKNKK
jgi:hypothetical protein